MNKSDQAEKGFQGNDKFQKGLMIVNAFFCLFLITVVLLAGITWRSDRVMMGMLNKIVYPRLNRLIENNPEQMALLIKNISPDALASLANHVLASNKEMLVGLMMSLEHRAVAEVLNEAVSRDPLILSELLSGLKSEPLSKAVNMTLEEQAEFLSDFVGTLDTAALEDIINQIAENHTDFMADLVDKIIEMIRKDFMKSGI